MKSRLRARSSPAPQTMGAQPKDIVLAAYGAANRGRVSEANEYLAPEGSE